MPVRLAILLTAILALPGLMGVSGCASQTRRVTLYCSQDEDFAKLILNEFSKRSFMPVASKFDTEAAKSVGLVSELALEAKRPRCDVHWNNEVLGSIRLQRLGVYEPYQSPITAAYPESCRARDGSWTAFAARARVIVVNTDLVPESERPRSLFDLLDPKWKGKVAMAKPTHGTSATQAACLFDVLGPEAAQAWYTALKANDVQIVPGNRHVAVGVGQGKYALGITDTDDVLLEMFARRPIAMIFPDRAGHPAHPRMGSLFIPNTIAIVKNSPNPAGARQLADYLLSSEIEQALAEGASHQIPLNPAVKAKLPPGVETPSTVNAMEVDWEKAADRWDEAMKFVTQQFGS